MSRQAPNPPKFMLTQEQQQIVGHDPARHARVLAGPGTGKSFTSVALLERLALEQPSLRCQMITFTRAATAEFAQKQTANELLQSGRRPKTVHGFALQLLLGHGAPDLPRPLRIPGRWEMRSLIEPDIARRLKARGFQADVRVVRQLMSELGAGWESLEPDRVTVKATDPALATAFAGLWREHRSAFGYVLLAELPYQAAMYLEDTDASVDLDLLLVDEYQDLNRADIKLVSEIARRGVSVLAIGDDDQSIYRFRMAAPQGIREFTGAFPGAADYSLTESRRCGSSLIAAANAVISAAPSRPAKRPLRSSPGAPPGTFAHLRFDNDRDEATEAARFIAGRIAQGVPPGEIAILVRSGVDKWSDALAEALGQHGVALASTDWVDEALSSPGLRRTVAICTLACERADSLAWWTVLRLTSGVGDRLVDFIYDSREPGEQFGAALLRLAADQFPGAPAGKSQAIAAIEKVLSVVGSLDLGVTLDGRGWGGWIVDNALAPDLTDEAERLLEMVGAALPAEDGLAGFMSQLEPMGKDLAASESDGVRLMTMAQSKGLTVNTAIVMGVEDGLIPMPPPKGDLEEERRLLYVALTRATDVTVATWSHRRTGPIARQGQANVRQSRQRSELIRGLPGFPAAVPGRAWIQNHLAPKHEDA